MRNGKNAENRGRYRGRRGLTGEQTMVLVMAVIAAVLLAMMYGYSRQTGVSIGEQICEALFVARDWD